MPDRTLKLLKLACLILAAFVVYQLAHVAPRVNILGHVVIPALPALPKDTNAPPTNGVPPNLMKLAATGTNKAEAMAKTNGLPAQGTNNADTNFLGVGKGPKMGTNFAGVELNNTNATNVAVVVPAGSSNVMIETNITNVSAGVSTNDSVIVTNLITGTNAKPRHVLAGTNGSLTNLMSGTNTAMLTKTKGKRPGAGGPPGMMMMGGMGFGGGAPLPPLPPEIKARIDRIYESEILGQAIRPLPAGLLGIAGELAFLRSANGQTGMVKEGDSLGDLKLLRIGINRVLVEQAGEKKELMIFEGYGGTSLLSEKGKNPE